MTPYPSTIYIGVGTVCGYNCIYCNNPRMLNKKSLRIGAIRNLLDEFPAATKCDVGGYGEFLLHPDFEEIVAMLTARNMPFSFSTNGQELAPWRQALLRRSSLWLANFSMNTFEPELHKFMSGGVSNFPEVLGNFSAFCFKPRSYKVNASMVVNRFNFREMPDFVAKAAHYGADSVRLSAPVREIEYPHGFDLVNDAAEEESLLRAHEVGKEWGIEVGGMMAGHMAESDGPRARIPIHKCRAPWSTTCINEDGTVTPCCFGSSYPVGNVNDQPFKEIWDGPKMTDLREAITAGSNRLCKNCMEFA